MAFPHAAPSLSFYKIVLHSTCMDVCMGIVYKIDYLRACARAREKLRIKLEKHIAVQATAAERSDYP